MSKGLQQRMLGGRWNRRAVLRGGALAAAGVAGAAVLGCSSDDNETPAQENAGQPKSGGTLRAGLLSDLNNLEPHAFVGTNYDVTWPIWDLLTKYDHDLKPVPQLVKSWEQTNAGAQIVLRLREGVTYHSGRPFTSDDVKWNLDRIKDTKLAFAQLRNFGVWFPTVETPDKQTVILKSDKPRPATFDFFELFRMADPVTMQAADAATQAVGTGPWKLGEWKQGISLKLLKNPTYWNTGRPYLDGVTWSLALGADTQAVQLESGALELAQQPPFTSFTRLRDNSNFKTMVHPTTGVSFVSGMNQQKQPFNDKRVRQAFNWAYNRQQFANLIMRGTVQPASLPWPSTSIAFEEAKNKHYSQDLKKAADLLKAAGVNNLKTTAISQPGIPEQVEFLPIWQADLKTIGVDLQIRILEAAAYLAEGNMQADGSIPYDAIYAARGSFGGLTPSTLFLATTTVWSGDGKNNTGFKNDRYVEIVNQASIEVDTAKAKKLYSELNDIILDESQVIVACPNSPRVALAKNLNGITHHMHEGFTYEDGWLA